ncbi:MAG: hypothetical protein JWQ70_382 [Aeromicrobium sp.]|nr:hypothetical protein [Aeromicrobium sp.]
MDIVLVVIALLVGVPVIVAVLRVVANDGYGHNPPPRSHRDEVGLTQHEKLRRLGR